MALNSAIILFYLLSFPLIAVLGTTMLCISFSIDSKSFFRLQILNIQV